MMRFVELDDVRVSRIGLGTWQFGSSEWGYGADYAEREAGAIVRRALDLGVNLVDTAEVYGFGRSERIVGRALQDQGRRHEAFVATKLFPALALAPIVVQRGRASARRLGIDRLDLYQVHWPNPLFPPSQVMGGMRRLQDEGLVAEVGVSNYPLEAWRTAERVLGRRVLSNQVQFNLVSRRAERDLIPQAVAENRMVIAYSPLAQGFLGARYTPQHLPGGLRRANSLFLPENLARAAPLLDTLRDVAAVHDVTPAQVALAWVVRRPNVVAIPGASSVEQLEANVAAAALDLSDDEDAALTGAANVFTPVTRRSALRRGARRLVGR